MGWFVGHTSLSPNILYCAGVTIPRGTLVSVHRHNQRCSTYTHGTQRHGVVHLGYKLLMHPWRGMVTNATALGRSNSPIYQQTRKRVCCVSPTVRPLLIVWLGRALQLLLGLRSYKVQFNCRDKTTATRSCPIQQFHSSMPKSQPERGRMWGVVDQMCADRRRCWTDSSQMNGMLQHACNWCVPASCPRL